MTAPLFHLPPGSLCGVMIGACGVLDGAEGHHAARVRRVRLGEVVQLADGSGLLARATVTAVDGGVVRVRVDECAPVDQTGPRFVLVQALAKGGRDELAVEAATELEVAEVVAWQAQRSVVIWKGERGERSLRKWASIVNAASKQARRASVPLVTGPLDTVELVARIRNTPFTYVLHEQAAEPLSGVEIPETGEVMIVVGPEGGIGDSELWLLAEAGAKAVRLGHAVLRSSTAGPAALALLNSRTRWR